jgi:hypothetical protein
MTAVQTKMYRISRSGEMVVVGRSEFALLEVRALWITLSGGSRLLGELRHGVIQCWKEALSSSQSIEDRSPDNSTLLTIPQVR